MCKLGKFYVLEGPDGVGKTALSELLAMHLNEKGIKAHCFSFPGKEKGTIGEYVYDLHHEIFENDGSASNASLQALHIAAHIDAIESTILPILKTGENIILDRYWWSTWVYGVVSGVKKPLLKKLIDAERLAWNNIKPHAIFLIQRDAPLREEPKKQWLELKTEYDVLFQLEMKTTNVFKINNTSSVKSAIEEISRCITSLKKDSSTSAKKHAPRENKPNIFSKMSPVKTTEVFDTYWRFATERQSIFFSRFHGEPYPWTSDPIFLAHKFTNAYRASDRVSQFLIRNVIYTGSFSAEDMLIRIMLFKFFNKVETWETLENKLGEITAKNFCEKTIGEILSEEMTKGKRIYSPAYIMPSGSKALRFSKKHLMHLHLLKTMIEDGLASKLEVARSMKEGFELFLSYPSIGNFLAYQFITDINYSEITDFKETEFVMPGPGALDGIRKCFRDTGGLNECEIIQWVMEHQDQEFARLGLAFQSLWGRPLQLIDCQNLFCEVDKYSRVKHPEIVGITGRKRIKQKYKQDIRPILYFYPPKWGINDKIEKEVHDEIL